MQIWLRGKGQDYISGSSPDKLFDHMHVILSMHLAMVKNNIALIY